MHAKKISTHSYVNELNLVGTGNKATTHSSWRAYYLTLITVATSLAGAPWWMIHFEWNHHQVIPILKQKLEIT